jgi:predicted metal-dependent HD superfamily phosphohydrolase
MEVAARIERKLAELGARDDIAATAAAPAACYGEPHRNTTRSHILRRKVLQSFLLRERIFATGSFRERYESRARANLTRLIGTLQDF